MKKRKEVSDDRKLKRKTKKECKEMMLNMEKLAYEEKKGKHLDMIKRLTVNGKKLFSPDKMGSPEVLEMILFEYELDDDDSDDSSNDDDKKKDGNEE